ncbi:L-2-hydroxyglutarate oxidase [Kutzneria viridogrisea]|uniref:L-2-hydroxyglutarate oxidase LhgO n=2 Tax=Kutzneria TaxID=43356 RepID=W5VYK6_9PSEU|nr:L-2-hydroxyglutarate oxidase [Kutzneria albida]AHH93530.1 L-2-hydroxyglutarate oxidase LhgO [Kutzneria albida DSM 43870]MBA8929084.1 L-2-hydroxyglutarate oxidase [Kutzneria viridogrisea]
MSSTHVVVIGGGIVGLATAHELAVSRGHRVTVLEKENDWAAHQTGHNSGVVHAGLYYKPGSLKARMSVAGNKSIVDFARDNGIAVQVCGKLVVATEPGELDRLRVLAERAAANGVPASWLTPEQAREFEPEVSCLAALRVPSTGIIDYPAVARAFVRRLTERGADLRTASPALGIRSRADRVEVATPGGVLRADVLVNCAGLHSDRVAELAGVRPQVQIVPFRGEYYELRPERAHLVRGLIYPVPDPALPFLGVHLTRGIDGGVHAGPNAVLALSREGYRWRDVSVPDLARAAGFSGTWRLAAKFPRVAVDEMRRSVSRKRFAASLARLVPAVGAADIVRADAGVRAQAVRPDGSLVDDFWCQTAARQVHVLNTPSPAATSSLEIARHLADLAEEQVQ